MKCYFCEQETDTVKTFADGIERPSCGCQNKQVDEYVKWYENQKNKDSMSWTAAMKLQKEGLL